MQTVDASCCTAGSAAWDEIYYKTHVPLLLLLVPLLSTRETSLATLGFSATFRTFRGIQWVCPGTAQRKQSSTLGLQPRLVSAPAQLGMVFA